jgi:GT2 family glycosyltransferase
MLKIKLNKGFSYGMNYGLKYANAHGCTEIIASNNDIVFNPNTIDLLATTIRNNSDIAITAPLILSPLKEVQNLPLINKLSNIEYLILKTRISAFFKNRVKKFILDKEIIQNNFSYDVYKVSGSCFAISAKILNQINYLDENIFFYYEEFILSDKIYKISKRILYLPRVSVMHYHGATIGKNTISLDLISHRSELYYLFNYRNVSKFFLKIIIFIRQIEVLEKILRSKNYSKGFKDFSNYKLLLNEEFNRILKKKY